MQDIDELDLISSHESRARIARDQAQRKAALWQLPVLTQDEAAEVSGLPDSTLSVLKKMPDAPPFFGVGKRQYILTSELRTWFAVRAKGLLNGE